MQVIGHRGTPLRAPENTLASFEGAASEGADGVELDVHRCADGELVVIHDFTVDRTTDGSGIVWDLDLAELRSLDAGAWFGDRFRGEVVPTLAEVLALPGLDFEVELKVLDIGAVGDAIACATSAGVLDRVEFTSSSGPLLVRLQEIESGARVGTFSSRRQGWMPDQVFESLVLSNARLVGADVVHVHADDLTPTLSRRLHDDGRVVHANDASSPAAVRSAMSCGADRISGNDPSMIRATLDG